MENRATEFRFIWRFVHFSRCLHDRLDRKIDKMKVLCTITLFWRRMIENSFEFTTGESRRMFTYYLPTDLSVFWYCLNKQPQRANWNHSACSLSSKMPNFCLGWLSKMKKFPRASGFKKNIVSFPYLQRIQHLLVYTSKDIDGQWGKSPSWAFSLYKNALSNMQLKLPRKAEGRLDKLLYSCI